ncbi:hypothetical protein ACFQX8_02140 [Klenkia terrae]|uniref:hypothetical protein n=1 Tax=Klenkia terrae TaxID=1052259 RepID=UPI00360D94F8
MRFVRFSEQSMRRASPLWCYLTALVLLPLLGVMVLATAAAQTRASEADSAARAENGMRTLAALDGARRSVEQELIPFLWLHVVANPEAIAMLDLPPGLLEVQAETMARDSARVRAVTDRALAGVPAGSVGSAAAERAATDLALLRSGGNTLNLDIEDVYFRFLAVSNDLMTAQQAAAAAATAEGIPGSPCGHSRTCSPSRGSARSPAGSSRSSSGPCSPAGTA